ncbi:FAD-binding oxidoreductase [Planctomycetota bacterium]
MMTEPFIKDMERIVGKQHVSVSRSMSEIYSYDASLARGEPGMVVIPADEQEIAQVVRAASQAGIPFAPRGFGTNLSGGTIVADQGLVICLSRLNRILGIYPESRYAVVQTGVTNLELQGALDKVGYFYAPDPASQKVSTMGGNLGENSGGPRCLKYGVTTNHILGLKTILPDGEIVHLGCAALDPPGYDLRGTMVGSEGTLGIVTEMTVRILPQIEKVITMLGIYETIADAAQSVSGIIAAGIVPNTLEMMDATIIKAVEDSNPCGYPRDAAAVLIIEVEGPVAGLKEQAQRIQEICKENNCREVKEAKNEAERNLLWQGRRGAFGAVARLAPNYLVNDATVPRSKLPEALAQVAEITKKYNCEHGNVFHAGDGNLHPLLLFDSRDEDQLHRVEKAGWEIMQACVDLGGTISGEHGIGMEKRKAMRMVFSEVDLEEQRRLKRSFDPRNLLNPGKIIPPPPKAEDTEKPAKDLGIAVAKIVETIKNAASSKQTIIPTGSGSYSHFGNLSPRDTTRLASTSLAEVVEYDPPNQVITVGAGMSLQALQKHLQAHKQWLPVRPPFFTESSTIGRLIALGACGPERLLYGAPRDLVLGLRYINSAGQVITTGGRVVKNVTGYDMPRLLTGSAGTLGFITEATWRVAVMPERCTTITAENSLDECAAMALAILKSNVLPTFVTCVPGPSAENKLWNIVIGFEGFSQTVDYQLDKCAAALQEHSLKVLDKTDYSVHEGVFGPLYEQIAQAPFILRSDLLLNQVAGFFKTLDQELSISQSLLDSGNGRIYAGLNELSNEQWRTVCDCAAKHEGHVLLEKAPDTFKEDNDVFGIPDPAWKIMHRVKNELDPDKLFAPGQLPGKV